MLTTRHPRRSWAYDDRHQGDTSMFRLLARHWRPVVAELRNAASERHAGPDEADHRKALPACWSPWLWIK